MNVAIFGGTFDPIHNGHLVVARAARDHFDLKTVYFVPADAPPHKLKEPVTAFAHRYAMTTLAVAGERAFVPSLLDARDCNDTEPSYSIQTVRKLRATLKRSDRLFFITGIDAFLGISKWRDPEALLSEAEFIVASRPGFSLADIGAALPARLRPSDAVVAALRKQPATGDIVLANTTIHLLADVRERVSATQIRDAVAGKRSFARLVPDSVADYIKKVGLYRSGGNAAFAERTEKVVSISGRKRIRNDEEE